MPSLIPAMVATLILRNSHRELKEFQNNLVGRMGGGWGGGRDELHLAEIDFQIHFLAWTAERDLKESINCLAEEKLQNHHLQSQPAGFSRAPGHSSAPHAAMLLSYHASLKSPCCWSIHISDSSEHVSCKLGKK